MSEALLTSAIKCKGKDAVMDNKQNLNSGVLDSIPRSTTNFLFDLGKSLNLLEVVRMARTCASSLLKSGVRKWNDTCFLFFT